MSSISLNISGKIDNATVNLYQIVANVADRLRIPFIVVGASARDIVLHYGHGANIERATTDVDVGVYVPDWSAFNALKQALLDKGFATTEAEHRLISPGDVQVDIIPFGEIEDDQAKIAWPPQGNWVMNMRGFQEALGHADIVRIQDTPPVDIPVATPQGLVVLKLIAWLDRSPDKRDRDATDLIYLLRTYEKIPSVSDWLYKDQKFMEEYDWDLTLSGARKLGVDSRMIVLESTYETIVDLFEGKHKTRNIEQLVGEMSGDSYERNEALLNAFLDGFLSIPETHSDNSDE